MRSAIVLVEAQAADQLVGQAGLAGAAGAGDAEHRRLRAPGRAARSSPSSSASALPFSSAGDELRQGAPAPPRRAPRIAASVVGACGDRSTVAAHHHLADHSRPGPCAGRPRGCRCARRRRPAARAISAGTITPPPPPKTWMCSPPRCAQQVDHVLEVLDVAALVGADRDALHVFLQRRGDDLVDRAVVAEVDHLGAHALQDAAHDVDRRVVAVEQRRGGDEAHLVRRAVVGERLEFGGRGRSWHGLRCDLMLASAGSPGG